jgi:hypothetical protein
VAPSAKFVKTDSNLIVVGTGYVWAYEAGSYGYGGYGYGYGYPYGGFYDLHDIAGVGLGDFLFMEPISVGNTCLFGYFKKFSGLKLIFTTPGVAGTYTWQYWNGTSWSILPVSDTTLGFTTDSYVNWKLPTGWVTADNNPYNIPNTGEQRYWVRVRVDVPPTTPPIAKYIGLTFVGQTCRGCYVGHSGTYPDPATTPSRDKNNCYIYYFESFEKPKWQSGFQDIVDKLKTAGTIAIINQR